MKIRYCQANNFNNPPCPVGWGSAHSDQGSICHIESCLDNPREKNCRYLVDNDESQIEYCPHCGTALGVKDNEEIDLPIFGSHLKEATKAIKDIFRGKL